MELNEMNKRVLPAEWFPQDAIMLAWPHKSTDWGPMLEEAQDCFFRIIETITIFEDVMVIINDKAQKFPLENFLNKERIHTVICPTNDTWARDFGPIFIKEGNQYKGLDFKFNGWGLKFAADQDNLITSRLFEKNIFAIDAIRENHLNFVFEGGSIESDGEGTILTTTECLMSPNRNGSFSLQEVEMKLKSSFGADRILWINHGFLSGDDTDSHVDTLARFCNPETIAYIKCNDPRDEHFEALKKMENQLRQFKTTKGKPYNLVPLPMADPYFDEENRLPATYANFLIINKAVLVPFYNSIKDQEAKNILEKIFTDSEVIGIDCRPLIKQHGSLHCVTMQLPVGVLKKTLNKENIVSINQ
jgi:agmatine deiminase